ncbi:MAG TPA: ribbon-helix-helix protein, CopG family [Microthrixaceae bacterium]|jgi:predicted transcriptional regulator|nr:ribbon-helix-helix protein, CopG family [Microthrixaceae bacterium]HQF92645.1 ribbon-helix-helix protein, CopG family [Microthrixaceae bacterium]
MARPREFDDRVTKAVRLSPQLDERLKALARERQVSVNLIMNWALEEYVEQAPRVEDLRVRSSRAS